jgi:formylglycine-generating enzyme required for sulfatase activity
MNKRYLRHILFIIFSLLLAWPNPAEAGNGPKTIPGMVFVKGGCYQMGCGSWTDYCSADEKPVHEVCVKDFYIAAREVMQEEWVTLMGNNPSAFTECDVCPVENVSWNDVQKYIRKLNEKTGRNYRLPTEAEWEYAARSGGKEEKYAGTSSNSDIGAYAYYKKNSGGKPRSVGMKRPNGLGIYDMTGNVWEWLDDRYDKKFYSVSPRMNPPGPARGTYRVLRGGSWDRQPESIRASKRAKDHPDTRRNYYGFRCAMTP